MKKWLAYIWIGVASVAFVLLLIIQYHNFLAVRRIHAEQFEEHVHSALGALSRELEREEAAEYLVKNTLPFLIKEDATKGSVFDTTGIELAPRGFLIRKNDEDVISRVTRKVREEHYEEVLQKREIVDKVVSDFLREVHRIDIRERIDFRNLDIMLGQYLKEEGIDEDFAFNVKNRRGEVLYGTTLDNCPSKIYTQRLFPNDVHDPYYINITFPDLQHHLGFDFYYLLMPSTTIILLLFAGFVWFIVYLALQRKVNVTKNDFVSNLTHELKTPISSILLAAQMLDDDTIPKNPNMLARISKILNEEAKRLRFQVEKVLQLSALDKEKALMSFKLLDAHDIINGVVDNFALKVNSCGGEVVCDFKAANSIVMVDELHFTNMVYNLIDNALKYKRENPIIKISTWNEKGHLWMAFEDNGIGIKKGDLKHIFERFYRASTGNRHDVKGFGLGLSYVKKIVEMHKGKIMVESEEGVGTRFTVEIDYCEQ